MHLSNTAGDLFPAKELCGLARDRGITSMVDGAQSFGLMDVDLSEIQPDFYTGSAHKWPCGPKETGVLFVNARVQDRFWPSSYSAYPGRTGISRTHEGMGQRDTPALYAFGTQIEFLQSIGQGEIEARSRELANQLIEGLNAIDGVHMWTPAEPGAASGRRHLPAWRARPASGTRGARGRRHRGCLPGWVRPRRDPLFAPLLQHGGGHRARDRRHRPLSAPRPVADPNEPQSYSKTQPTPEGLNRKQVCSLTAMLLLGRPAALWTRYGAGPCRSMTSRSKRS